MNRADIARSKFQIKFRSKSRLKKHKREADIIAYLMYILPACHAALSSAKWTVWPLEKPKGFGFRRHSIIEVVEIPSGLLRRHLGQGRGSGAWTV